MITQDLVCQFNQLTFELTALKLENELHLVYRNRYGPSFPESGKKLISSMMNKSPILRPNIKEVLESDFFKEVLDKQWIDEERVFYSTPVKNVIIEQSFDANSE